MTQFDSVSALPYSGNQLYGSDEIRGDQDRLLSLEAQGNALFLPFKDLTAPLNETGDLHWITRDTLDREELLPPEAIFLGLRQDETPMFAFDITWTSRSWDQIIPYVFSDARYLGIQLADHRASIISQARSILHWISHNRFCSKCGSTNDLFFGGYRFRCANVDCAVLHFPRINPVVIVLVETKDGESCLLGRGQGYPDRIISPLAGFVEPGESVEDAVQREIMEEVGIQCTNACYFGSQPWPFPATLMIGCFAKASTDHLRLDPREIEFADWFTRDQLNQIFAKSHQDYIFPQSISIAYHMMKHWMERR